MVWPRPANALFKSADEYIDDKYTTLLGLTFGVILRDSLRMHIPTE